MGHKPKEKECNHTGTPLFVVANNVKVGGASRGGLYCDVRTTTLCDLRAYDYNFIPTPQDRVDFVPDRLKGVFKTFRHRFETIEIPWPDGGTPPFENAFYLEIVKAVKPGGLLVFACVGGHGRTGTALAGMRIVHLGESALEAIRWVRTYHCKKAIETQDQMLYLADLAGKGERQLFENWFEEARKEAQGAARK